jgi:glucose uptake protein
MVIIQSYPLAVVLCFITMLCWGSWANTRKLVSGQWPFQLFYWDYALGVLILSLLMAFTLGNAGIGGRCFLADLAQASAGALLMAFLGGVVFNLSHILFVGALDIAGMAVAYPVTVGIALVVGVISTYLIAPVGNAVVLFGGVAIVVLAILVDAVAYRRLAAERQDAPTKGIVVSIISGMLMGLFYLFVAASMASMKSPDATGKLVAYDPALMADMDPAAIVFESTKLGPYAAVAIFSLGIFLSNFIWNTIFMVKPFTGNPVSARDYFTRGSMKIHLVGVLGGIIWNLGMLLSILASGAAGFPISYGLGQGATLVAAVWGVFIWREFRAAPPGTNRLLGLMFTFYVVGLALIILAKLM